MDQCRQALQQFVAVLDFAAHDGVGLEHHMVGDLAGGLQILVQQRPATW